MNTSSSDSTKSYQLQSKVGKVERGSDILLISQKGLVIASSMTAEFCAARRGGARRGGVLEDSKRPSNGS